ncbi:hypothetical protein P7K49_029391 [Saguinus oedipus]|uniref:Parathymosin n=1 Tax=Saguinus oedipus TaxID=9490 RepID=A0ABQ9U733_SAGOE|nr:hypothetical protein P7K49_029391 [Saguinus oedipus]
MSEKSVEAAAELSAKDLKEKKEKVEEKASRKERKKEVVEEEENGAEEEEEETAEHGEEENEGEEDDEGPTPKRAAEEEDEADPKRQKTRHAPLPPGWGWEASLGLVVGVGADKSSHSSPGSLLWAVHQSCHPLVSPQPSHFRLHPHSAIVPPPDLLHLSSPAGPQLLLSLLFLPPLPALSFLW